MNKRTNEAFKEWLKNAKQIEGEPKPAKFVIEIARRAFAAGANWTRTGGG